MISFKFKVDIVVAVLIPVLFTLVATLLFYGSPKPKVQQVESLPQSSDSVVVVRSIEGLEETVTQRTATKQFMTPMQLGLAMAIVMSFASLFGYYYPSKAFWYLNIILSLIFTIVGAGYVGIKLTLFFLPNLLLVFALALIVSKLFFHPKLIRFRMVLCSILGAAAVALYYFLLTKITRQPSGFQDIKVWFVNSLFNLVFITFGLSLAHLLIHRIRFPKTQLSHTMLSDDDEDTREL